MKPLETLEERRQWMARLELLAKTDRDVRFLLDAYKRRLFARVERIKAGRDNGR